jgi:acetyltransferase-like isoleucine patch superfamily enzyme
MTIESADSKKNRIEINSKLQAKGLVQLNIKGSNNIFRLSGIRFSPVNSTCVQLIADGDEACVEIGRLRRAINVALRVGTRSSIHIGNGTSFRKHVHLQASNSCSISIGEDCMFSSDIMLRTTDSHGIYDRDSGAHLNVDEDIEIGDHVWIGEGVRILKGSRIGSGTVIGMRSVVSGDVPSNVIAAGAPLRIVRKNITWER